MMLFAFTLIFCATAAPAMPADSRWQHWSGFLDRGDKTSRDMVHGTNWAGALLEQPAGTFSDVTGTFTVPVPQGSTESHAAIWVGIDGDTCRSVVLQVGITMSPDGNGGGLYKAWYQWYPDEAYFFSDLPISPGDTLSLSVHASSSTSGTTIINNLSNGHVAQTTLSSDHALCGRNAEWIVEDPSSSHGDLAPLANFSTIQFYDAVANGPNGIYFPNRPKIFDILSQDGDLLTVVSTNQYSVTIAYL